jgi:hypothetical protein
MSVGCVVVGTAGAGGGDAGMAAVAGAGPALAEGFMDANPSHNATGAAVTHVSKLNRRPPLSGFRSTPGILLRVAKVPDVFHRERYTSAI